MKAICTKYLGPTDTKGARIKAYTGEESLTLPLDHALSGAERHEKVVRALLEKYMPGCERIRLTYGEMPSGYVFTFALSLSPLSPHGEECSARQDGYEAHCDCKG